MQRRTAPRLVIFSDLDGTFLDHNSYSFGDALPAFHDCLSGGVPVVFCSSKTRAEMAPLLRKLECPDPFIAENGGAIFVPPSYFPFGGSGAIRLGAPYATLTSALDTVSRNLGIPICAFHQMTPSQIAAETGLTEREAKLAGTREFDEPFRFPDTATPDVDRFLKAVELRGRLRWTKGGRFHHLLGHAGKRPAVSILAALYRRWNPAVRIVGLGDSINDIGLLSAIDVAILVQKPNGRYDPTVVQALPGVQRSPLPGPRGWNVSVSSLLAGRTRNPQSCVRESGHDKAFLDLRV